MSINFAQYTKGSKGKKELTFEEKIDRGLKSLVPALIANGLNPQDYENLLLESAPKALYFNSESLKLGLEVGKTNDANKLLAEIVKGGTFYPDSFRVGYKIGSGDIQISTTTELTVEELTAEEEELLLEV